MRLLLLSLLACHGDRADTGGDTGASVPSVDADGDGFFTPDDCDDGDPAVHPGAEEVCNDVDDDCDGAVDVDASDATDWYRDADGDGFPDPDSVWRACGRPPGYREEGPWDCDDTSDSAWPGAEEVCGDGIDNDCDGDPSDCRLSGERSLGDADAVLWGVTAGDGAGSRLALAGDVDGDGHADLLVGAPYRDAAGSDAGVAYLVAGPLVGASSLSAARATLAGDSSLHKAGDALAGAGDVNGDGYDDVIIGAWGANGGGNDSGEAYVVHGPLSGGLSLGDVSTRVVGELAYDYAGTAVLGPGDLDGDGVADLVIGAPGYGNDSVQQRGAVYLVHGPVTGGVDLGEAALRAEGDERYDRLGSTLAGGDVDGDGLTDVLVGAPTWPSNDGVGAVMLFRGPWTGTEADLTLGGEDDDHRAGTALAVGDVDGDGLDDLLVGAPYATDDLDEQGVAYLVLGPLSGSLGGASARWLGVAEGDEAGAAVALGDVDGDGLADVLVGAPANDDAGRDAGAVYLSYAPLSGSHSLADADLVLTAVVSRDEGGASLLAGADLLGDGLSDLLVGAPAESTAGSDAGAVYGVAGAGF